MSAPEFRPGDRVRVRDFSTDPWVIGLVCEGPPVRPFVNTQPYGTHRFQETELVLRPVYPEPGQVAVLLDEDQRAIIEDGQELLRQVAREIFRLGDGPLRQRCELLTHVLDALLDRAWEASRG